MKKNLILSLAIAFLFSISALADPGTKSLTVTIGSGEYAEGDIAVPVYLKFHEDVTVGAFDLIIDVTDVEGSGVLSKKQSGFYDSTLDMIAAYNEGTNRITFSWALEAGINSSTLADNLLLTLLFDASVGVASLTFPLIRTTENAFYEVGTEHVPQDNPKIPTTFVNGLITVTPAVPVSMLAFFIMAGLITAFLVLRAIRLF